MLNELSHAGAPELSLAWRIEICQVRAFHKDDMVTKARWWRLSKVGCLRVSTQLELPVRDEEGPYRTTGYSSSLLFPHGAIETVPRSHPSLSCSSLWAANR